MSYTCFPYSYTIPHKTPLSGRNLQTTEKMLLAWHSLGNGEAILIKKKKDQEHEIDPFYNFTYLKAD
ncbi:hypothetical protein DXA38_18580 [[Clostridium] innocuum]|uniref:Uncharacterized protein n=1 Tax=Clostridium innocuum TaxID=1522 RepID=A0A3E2VL00_CLOIN|nr:hypothetical protein DXA38_18580 [[Clostridium] innocuum]RHV65233.1 hypothetical protein DXB22_08735 [Clostridiaceae bacterium OM02-2AC]